MLEIRAWRFVLASTSSTPLMTHLSPTPCFCLLARCHCRQGPLVDVRLQLPPAPGAVPSCPPPWPPAPLTSTAAVAPLFPAAAAASPRALPPPRPPGPMLGAAAAAVAPLVRRHRRRARPLPPPSVEAALVTSEKMRWWIFIF